MISSKVQPVVVQCTEDSAWKDILTLLLVGRKQIL